MIRSHAVENGVCAGGVVADHAAHGGTLSGGRVGAEHQSVFGGGTVERGQHHTRLDNGGMRIGVHVNDGVEVTRAIEDQRFAHGLTAERGARSARQDGDLVFCGQFHGGKQVILCLGNRHTERFDLIHRSVGGVEHARGRVVANVAAKTFAEVGNEIGIKHQSPQEDLR